MKEEDIEHINTELMDRAITTIKDDDYVKFVNICMLKVHGITLTKSQEDLVIHMFNKGSYAQIKTGE